MLRAHSFKKGSLILRKRSNGTTIRRLLYGMNMRIALNEHEDEGEKHCIREQMLAEILVYGKTQYVYEGNLSRSIHTYVAQ